ncbi:MAG: hypothetical protein ACE5JS_07370 [Nitrospinota bacterium]
MRTWKTPVWLLSAVAVFSLLALSADGIAQTKLKGFGKTIVIDILDGYVSPSDVAIQRGTTVIWNNATQRDVAVNFGMGDQVKRACVAPSGFVLSGNVYAAPGLRPGATASLCFVVAGSYEFTAAYQGAAGGEGREVPRGTITVKE